VKAGIDFGVRGALGILKLSKCYYFVVCHIWVIVPFVIERIPQAKVCGRVTGRSGAVDKLRDLIGKGDGFGVAKSQRFIQQGLIHVDWAPEADN